MRISDWSSDVCSSDLFAAWAEPALKRRWFGEADGWEDVEHRLDFRVGGSEYSSARQPGGPRHVHETVILNIVPARRIVFAYTMRLDDRPISTSLATVALAPATAGTQLHPTHTGAFFARLAGLASPPGTWAP